MATLLVLTVFTIFDIPSPSFDPSLSWFTLETEHFAVHFSCRGRLTEERVRFAQDVADICEEVHATLTPVVGWVPDGRTQVVIADFYDFHNGWAAPLPDNTITIIPTPPAGSRVNDDNWLRTLIIHEYSHILQFDMAKGTSALLRKLFGRLVIPNAILPVWLTEGYAVYNETRFTGFGRLRSSEHEMMLRCASLSKRLLSIDRCGTYELQRFPAGTAPYLYGSRFLAHLARKVGPDAPDRFNHANAGYPPFFENCAARSVYKSDLCRLWQRWLDSVRTSSAAAESLISRQPLTRLSRLTNEGFWTGSPCWSLGGREVYYIADNGREYPAIKAIDPATGDSRVLHRGLLTGSMSLSPDGRQLAFAEFRLSRNGYWFSDIFSLELATGRLTQLTHNLRARDPDFAPDTSLLVFVTNHDGQNDLCLLDLKTGTVSNLTETQDRTSFHSPRFSPGGRLIAVGVNRPGGYSDIELIDLTTGWTIPVTHDRCLDLSPCWSRTGKTLFFVSDRTGLFNLYGYNIESQQLFRCTNVLAGVFEPAVSPDNRRIALVSYSADGNDISLIEMNRRDWQEAEPVQDTFPFIEPAITPRPSQLYYYNPFPTILPKFWLPWFAWQSDWEAGAFTLGWDALQLHTYQLAAGYRHQANTPFMTLSYSWSRYLPTLTLSADLDLSKQSSSVTLSFPFLATKSGQWLDLGSRFNHETTVSVGFDAGWLFSNARSYRFSVAPVEGRTLGLLADARSRSILSEQDRIRLIAHWSEYFGFPPKTWSLCLHIAAGTAFGDTSANSAFRLGNRAGLFQVRGYPEPDSARRNIAATGLQLRLPLWWIERGIGTAPVFFQNVNGAVFCDWGTSWNGAPSAISSDGHRLGTGIELRLDFILARYLPLSITTGLAFGLSPELSNNWYLGVNSDLLSFAKRESRQQELYPRRLPLIE
ncbi:MAG: hypothetical protein ABIK44_02915 [candidate division WOR-3 bacterium]